MNRSWLVSPAPFFHTRPTVSRMSLVTAIALSPTLVCMAVAGDWRGLANVAIALVGSLAAELFQPATARKQDLRDGSVFVAALVAGLLFPTTINPIVCLGSTFTGYLVARVLFGGRGSGWLHPAAISVCIAYISGTAAFPVQTISSDSIRTVGEAFGALKLDNFAQLASDQSLTSSLNSGLLGALGIKLPEGYITLFCDLPSAVPAYRYNALVLVASIALLTLNVIDWVVPTVYLLSYSLLVYFLSLAPFTGVLGGGDILFALLTSGTLYTAFFLLPDCGTSPRTKLGRAFVGLVAGITAFGLCGPGLSPVGSAFTVVIVNAISPLVEYLEYKRPHWSGESR